ncbi:MAG: molybdenum cofactor guanylyltransferase [Cloacibacillus sp.]
MNVSAIILAGGKSSRFGSDKSLLKVDDKLLIERSIETWGDLFAEVVIVSDTGNKFLIPGVTETKDIYTERGPLGGVHAGLTVSSCKWSFVAACDMPSINRNLILKLFEATSENVKIILPHHDGVIEPLCALYHADCLSCAEKMLSADSNCILDMYDMLPTIYLKSENCFFNINYQEDAEKIHEIQSNLSKRYKRRLHTFCGEKGLRRQ